MMNLLAAFVFFTRLPLWRLREIPAHHFKHVVGYWPIVGWLTGGVMALVFWLSSFLFSVEVAVLLALISRVLLTGALHEDGLADFFDGFGGGRTRQQTLDIMKDSHIGTYGVLGLLFYFLLLWSLLIQIPPTAIVFVLLTGDVWSKFVAAQITNALPYARKEVESKIKTIYVRVPLILWIITLLTSLLPFLLLPTTYWFAALFPPLTFLFLTTMMKKRLQGYTGDCCGAMFLLCELSFYLGINSLLHLL